MFFPFLDHEKPSITDVPGNIDVNTVGEAAMTAVNWALPSASDNSGYVTLLASHNPGDQFLVGVTMVNYTAVDSSGNRATEVFSMTVHGLYLTIG